MRTPRHPPLFVVFPIVVLVACGDGRSVLEANPPASIEIGLASGAPVGGQLVMEAPAVTLAAAVRDRAGASLHYPTLWTSLNPSVVAVGPDGVLTAIDDGVGLIVAQAAPLADTVRVEVGVGARRNDPVAGAWTIRSWVVRSNGVVCNPVASALQSFDLVFDSFDTGRYWFSRDYVRSFSWRPAGSERLPTLELGEESFTYAIEQSQLVLRRWFDGYDGCPGKSYYGDFEMVVTLERR